MPSLWIEFVNSLERDYRGRDPDRDRLDDPTWMGDFLGRWRLEAVDTRRRDVREPLRRLRGHLERIARSLAEGRRPADRDVAALNRCLGDPPLRGRLDRDGDAFRLRLTATRRGLDAVLSAITASAAQFLVEADLTRLRICDNPDCGWVFLDATRSRTRRWCAHPCGNLMKVRKCRRHRQSPPR
jgi:predicted RNA-binding Zn ribbon-like protein